jgi:hypothetical protein
MNIDRIKEIQEETDYPESVSVQRALLKVWNETEQVQLRIPDVSNCFYLLSETKPPKNGKYEVITSRGRVIKAYYEELLENDIWEAGYEIHQPNEKVLAWRFLK